MFDSQQKKIKTNILAYNILLLACLFNSGFAASSEKTLKIGIVPQFEQRQLFRNWKPLIDELEVLTGFKFEMVGSAKIPIFEKQFNQGIYDLAYMNPYHVLKANASQGYIPLIRDSEKLNGILVVNKNSNINSIKQLSNETIAFPSPNALGASMMIRSILTETFQLKFASKYVQTHSSVFLHVAKNLVSAGGGVNKTFNGIPSVLKDTLKVIYTSQDIVSHPLVIHPRVPLAKRKNIERALHELFNSKKGKQLYKRIPMSNVVKATMKDYKSLEKLKLEKYFVK